MQHCGFQAQSLRVRWSVDEASWSGAGRHLQKKGDMKSKQLDQVHV